MARAVELTADCAFGLHSTILQENQLLLAQQLLGDPTRSIQQIGAVVGFTSNPAFHRAFKRWTGESPAAFRSSRLGSETGTPHGSNAQRWNEAGPMPPLV